MSDHDASHHPIIYVRGYAMTRGEIDETTADPFCGFNLGSTVFRATPEKTRPPRKFIFESPVVRLASDFGYKDVFDDGRDIMDDDWTGPIARKSIVIYRYYDSASNILGDGNTPDMEEFARGLSRLVLRVRDLVCANVENEVTPKEFRCHLVAHSMGGLVCRAFLQNSALDAGNARKYVDKFFTYATPHNGIDLAGVNVPSFLSVNDISNFNRERMSEYLDLVELYKKTNRVDWLPENSFPSERAFCLVGTNRSDYEAARGLSRTFSGHGSDGLVRIENSTLCGIRATGQETAPAAKAFVYRSHSGFFGIVNSEEAYQNLIRFLFGDVRVDLWIDIEDIRLPEHVQQEADEGRDVNAVYQIEILASPRGKLWYLTRRVSEEDSVACITHKDWLTRQSPDAASQYVSSVFLANRARVDASRPSLAYSMTVGVRVPDYEIDRRLWVSEHYEGSYLFHDSVVIELLPPKATGDTWVITYDWQSDGPGAATLPVAWHALKGGKAAVTIPFDNGTTPGITGQLRFVISEWNA